MKQRNVKLILLSSRGSINPHTNKKIKCSVWPPPAVLCKHPAIQHCGFGSCHIVPIKSHLTLLLISLWLPSLLRAARAGTLRWLSHCESVDRGQIISPHLVWQRGSTCFTCNPKDKIQAVHRQTKRLKLRVLFSTEKVHFLAFLILFVSPLFCPIPSWR